MSFTGVKGNEIILQSDPKGVFKEGIISGTPKPGTVMEIKNSTIAAGRATYQVWAKASGAKGLILCLTADALQGKLITDAYVTLTRGFLYCPVAGEELNMIVGTQTGTADDVAIGALFGVETATGKLIANNTYASNPFTAMEASTDPTADYLMWVTFNGH